MLAGNFPDLRRQLVLAFGNDFRGRAAGFIAQGDREVGRVRDDDIGFGNILHHPFFGHFALHPANSRLNLRVAVGLLVLLLDLRQAHLQRFFEFVFLVGIVRYSNEKQRNADPQPQRPDQAAHHPHRFCQRHAHRTQKFA